MKPNAVILINTNEVFDGIAATPLVHHLIKVAEIILIAAAAIIGFSNGPLKRYRTHIATSIPI